MLAGVVLACLSILLFVPPVYRLRSLAGVEVTRLDPRFGEYTVHLGPADKRWVPIRIISRHALYAVIVAEDARFYSHIGIDPKEIWISFLLNLNRGHFARGASTITQQVVKMAFLKREKTLLRKVREAIGALVLEQLMTKDEILEWYINLVEFGVGIYGVRDASRIYFQSRPEFLSVSQAILLAMVLPNPPRWSKSLKNKKLTPFGRKRFLQIVQQLRGNGYITPLQAERTLATGDFGSPVQ